MMKKGNIGILTAGGDSPGLNAAIRAVGKILTAEGWKLTGFLDGFDGVAFDRFREITPEMCSGILTLGGTVLHTSRNRPYKMPVNGEIADMTGEIAANCRRHRLDGLVCIGGGGTHKSALALQKAGVNVITIPKTIDNDLPETDAAIGFDTALGIATDAIDRLHSTASSHKRIMLVETMGHHTGWLTLGAGIAGGADAILIPELPYDVKKVASGLVRRAESGRVFSIVAVAEGAGSLRDAETERRLLTVREQASGRREKTLAKKALEKFEASRRSSIFKLAARLEALTGMESRVTVLGYLQRGGTPSCVDRILASKLGTACCRAIFEGRFGYMVAGCGEGTRLVPLEEVAGRRHPVPEDHPWLECARSMGVVLGD